MPNPFDQFDNTQKNDNPFDKFDDLTHIPAKEPPDRSLKQPALGYTEAMQKEAYDQSVIDGGVAYKDVQNKKQLPTMWSPVLSGDITGRVRAVRDDLAGGYVFADPNNIGKMRIVTRLNDGTLSSKPFSYGDPQRDMTATERFFAGMGKGIIDTGRGIKQAGQFVGNKMGMVSDEDLQKSYEEEQAIREQDKPLMDTGSGFAGNVAGNLLTFLAPAAVVGTGAKIASKAARVAPQGSKTAKVLGKTADIASKTSKAIVAPTTYKGAAALGATIGGLAPTTSGEERALNTVISGATGAAVPAAISGVGKLAKKISPNMGGGVLDFVQPSVVSANTQTVNQQQAEQLAQDATQRMGFDFNAMDDALKSKLSQQVADAINTESGITPEGVVKKILLEQEGFKPTRAMLTGKPSDYQLEDSLRRQVEGDALNVIDIENNANLLAKIRGVAKSANMRPEEFGEVLRKQLSKEKDLSDARVSNLYNAALRNEGGLPVDIAELFKHMDKNKSTLSDTGVDKVVLSYLDDIGLDDVVKQLKGLGAKTSKTTMDTESKPMSELLGAPKPNKDFSNLGLPAKNKVNNTKEIPVTNADSLIQKSWLSDGLSSLTGEKPKVNVKMANLIELRKRVNADWKTAVSAGDTNKATQLDNIRSIINDVEKQINAPISEKARVSRFIHGRKWESSVLDKIFREHPLYKGEMQIADADLFTDAFVKPSIDKTKPLWDRMNKSQKDAARTQLAQYIEKKTFSNMATTSGLERDVIGSAAKFIKVLNEDIGYQKLKLMIGKEQADNLLLQAKLWREIQHPPSGTKATGSAPELAVMQRRIIDLLRTSTGSKVPFVGSALGKLSQVAEERAAKQLRRNQAALALSPIEAEKQIQEAARQSNRERGRLVVPFSALQQSTQAQNE